MREILDGVYAVEFTGKYGNGKAIMVLSDGKAWGTDRRTVWVGTYEINEREHTAFLAWEIIVPRDLICVTGRAENWRWRFHAWTKLVLGQDSGTVMVETSTGDILWANYRLDESLGELPRTA